MGCCQGGLFDRVQQLELAATVEPTSLVTDAAVLPSELQEPDELVISRPDTSTHGNPPDSVTNQEKIPIVPFLKSYSLTMLGNSSADEIRYSKLVLQIASTRAIYFIICTTILAIITLIIADYDRMDPVKGVEVSRSTLCCCTRITTYIISNSIFVVGEALFVLGMLTVHTCSCKCQALCRKCLAARA